MVSSKWKVPYYRFDVDGIIELKQGIYLVNHPDLSIIGQTVWRGYYIEEL